MPCDRAYHGNGISAGFSKDSAMKTKHIEIHRNLSAFCFQWSYSGPNFQTSVSSCTNTRSPCKIQICTHRFLHMRAVPILAVMWHSENRCYKILAHILWEQQWHQSCWKHSSHFYFSLLGSRLSCFLWRWKSSPCCFLCLENLPTFSMPITLLFQTFSWNFS